MTRIIFTTIIFSLTALFVQCNDPKGRKNGDLDLKYKNDSCKVVSADSSQTSMQSEITCPKCKHKKLETLPTDICLIKYTCEKCNVTIYPEDGDCCVFCSYSTEKCPSKQDQ